MKFSRIYLSRLQNQPNTADTVVVIDVLRAFTTVAVAFARGAARVYPVDGVSAAARLAGEIKAAVTVGAVVGGTPVAGFDFGNSPAQLMAADLTGKHIVITTAAGVDPPGIAPVQR